MICRLIVAALVTAAVYCADHNLFKDCSRVPFCAKMRHQSIETKQQFGADISSFTVGSTTDIVNIPLSNENGQELNLQVSLLEGQMVRVKILEKNHSRYELADVLDGEPKTVTLKVNAVNTTTLELVPADTTLPTKIVIGSNPPFHIEFGLKNEVEVVLNGSQLVIENTDASQAFSFNVEFEDAQRLYGLHHHAYKLELDDTADTDPFRLRNSDTSGYEVGSPMALYGSAPVLYGHSNISTSGIFLHNAAEQWVDISFKTPNPSAFFMVESGTFDLFVLLGPTPKDVVRQITSLTGVAHLPQLWTLGYHQSRWSYYTQEEVKDVIANFDSHNFPIDAIWLDIDYTDGKRYFTWNPENFSDPIEMQKNISSSNRQLVTILDPHIKIDDDYSVYAGAKDKYFVKWANGSDFQGNCWPGLSSYLDFLSPEARDYYASWYAYDKFNGSTSTLAGVWNDMNEPSVFDDSLEKTLPFETLHYGDVLHRDIHNIYGFLQTKATHQGLMQRDNGTKRPFVLTRSHFAGSQRYAAMWTGDNTADWPYLRISYSECMLSNLMGLVFCGADVGGFAGTPDEELFQRWYQAAIWLPFFRGHAEETTARREPYLYSEAVQAVIRSAINLRYNHVTQFYTLFFEHTKTGAPIVRPVFYNYPGTVDEDESMLIGDDIFAAPVLEAGATSRGISFPGDSSIFWYRKDSGSTIHHGGTNEIFLVNITTSPYFYRSGSVVTRVDIDMRSTKDVTSSVSFLHVCPDLEGNAYGTYYFDDYTSFNYVNGDYTYVYWAFNGTLNELNISVLEGSVRDFTIKHVIVHRRSELEYSYKQLTYFETVEGKLLADLHLGELLNNEKKTVTLKLK